MKPPLCPRCGNEEFTTAISYDGGEGQPTRLTTYTCVECELAYEDELETWRDERGLEWTMTEAGT